MNDLRVRRRRVGYFQREVAFLMGLSRGTTVSRHEKRQRLPDLATAIAYEIILGVPVRDLFHGDARAVEERIRSRAVNLYGRLARGTLTPKAERKLLALRLLARQ